MQYAYVRTNSILDKAAQEPQLNGSAVGDCKELGIAEAPPLKKDRLIAATAWADRH